MRLSNKNKHWDKGDRKINKDKSIKSTKKCRCLYNFKGVWRG